VLFGQGERGIFPPSKAAADVAPVIGADESLGAVDEFLAAEAEVGVGGRILVGSFQNRRNACLEIEVCRASAVASRRLRGPSTKELVELDESAKVCRRHGRRRGSR